jgi:hypothetical protein
MVMRGKLALHFLLLGFSYADGEKSSHRGENAKGQPGFNELFPSALPRLELPNQQQQNEMLSRY